ncbi:MAG: protein kinase [Deltaproteobacteria bacterium]|nr:protein kinase [Deltaproteobacteria bacterium]
MDQTLDVLRLAPGTVLIDKYRVVQTIGIGGMGVVVCAEHMTLETRVAIKFLLPSLLPNERIVHRFLREARAAIQITSDHVTRVLDVGTLPDGLPFMVMEYLVGRDLSFWVKSGRRFSVQEAVDHVVQAGEALAQAHRLGIIHRDIKTANLFLSELPTGPPRVKVLDFGISKLTQDKQEMELTKTSAVLGSGLYMSPEQMRSARDVDYRTDIYALGICLYELLTGTQPFTAESFSELVLKVNMDPPTPLRALRPDVPEELAQIAARAYARERAQRYGSVAELVLALAPYASPPARALIEAIQQIEPGTLRPSAVAAAVTATVTGPAGAAVTVAGTTPGTATTADTPRSRAPLVAVGIGALIALGAGIFLLRVNAGAGPAGTAVNAPALRSASPTPEPALRSAPGPATSGTASSARALEPATSASADARAAASASSGAPKAGRGPGAPRPTARPGPAPSVQPGSGGLCFRLNAKTGMREMVPCQ